MEVNRENWLRTLEAVSPGLAPREFIEQSSCFVFRDGLVMTYNDEIACVAPSLLDKEVTGAVPGEKLLELLRKLGEEKLTVTLGKGELLLDTGKRRKAGVRLEAQLVLPVDSVPRPKKWLPLPDDFIPAMELVQECAGRDESQFSLTCLHWHPEFLEACDNHQLCRFRFASEVSRSVLLRKEAVKHVVGLGVTQFTETEGWVHFRNSERVTLACRRYLEDYPDLTAFLKVKGSKAALPKGLVEAGEKAAVFSEDNQADGAVQLTLKPGKLILKGSGAQGWYRESKDVQYEGATLSFYVQPRLFAEVTQRGEQCEVTSDRLKVNGGKFTYCACLVPVAGEDESRVVKGK